jgi:hypothetical protein
MVIGEVVHARTLAAQAQQQVVCAQAVTPAAAQRTPQRARRRA